MIAKSADAFEVVDAHHHLWSLSAVSYPWLMASGVRRFFGDPEPIQRDYLLSDFRADHGTADVTASVHIQVGAADPLAETRWLAAHAQEARWPMAIVAAADLTAPDLESNLDALTDAAEGRLRGIRQIVARHPSEDGPTPGALLGDRAFARGLEALARRSLSFDLQLTAPLLRRAAILFSAIPGLRTALCHCGSPWSRSTAAMVEWEQGLAAFAEVPGAVAKISGLGMLRPGSSAARLIATMQRHFPADRLMWGSNVPVDALARPWRTLLDEATSRIPPQSRQSIFADTARRFYRP